MGSDGIKKTTKAALLAALTFAATMLIRVPVPATGGYVHPGDALVFLGGALVGPLYGFLGAGIGSALADVAGGYMVYVPATFVIKGLAALVTALIYRRNEKTGWLALGSLAGAAVIVLGYFAFEGALYGFPAAFVAIFPNVVQVLFGVLVATALRAQGAVKMFER